MQPLQAGGGRQEPSFELVVCQNYRGYLVRPSVACAVEEFNGEFRRAVTLIVEENKNRTFCSNHVAGEGDCSFNSTLLKQCPPRSPYRTSDFNGNGQVEFCDHSVE